MYSVLWDKQSLTDVLQIKTTMHSNEWDKYQMHIDRELILKLT